jgi:tetratricopeptide (TPR) repeat protein
MLLLLDNAADSAQVRPLLPGAGLSAVIVTSRNRLSGMVARHGASIVSLPLLSEAEAITLLERTIGSHRVRAEPSAAVTLAHQCAFLPLAIRIAAERATARRTTLAELTEQLSAGRERLDLLAADDDETGIRTILSWSYHALPDPAARAFRLLGLHPGSECGIGALAALLGDGPAARMAASSLVDAHLVEETVDGRLRLHDLLYAYAVDRAAEDEPAPMRTESWNRLVDWYLYSALAAESALIPGRVAQRDAPPDGCEPVSLGSYDEAYAWYEVERTNLISLVHRSEPALAWRMAAALSGYFLHAKRWSDWTSTHEAGLRAAESVGDEAGQARMLSSLGAAYVDQHRWADALDHLGRALVLRQRTGERVFQGYINNNMAQALGELGRYEESLGAYRQAIAIFTEVGELYGLGSAYNNLGWALTELGRYADAEPALQESLRIHREAGYRYGEGMALDSLGTLYRKTGRAEAALDHLQRALALRTEIDDRHGMAMTHAALGDLLAAGDEDGARLQWRTALEIFEAVGAPQAAEMRAKLAQGS